MHDAIGIRSENKIFESFSQPLTSNSALIESEGCCLKDGTSKLFNTEGTAHDGSSGFPCIGFGASRNTRREKTIHRGLCGTSFNLVHKDQMRGEAS